MSELSVYLSGRRECKRATGDGCTEDETRLRRKRERAKDRHVYLLLLISVVL